MKETTIPAPAEPSGNNYQKADLLGRYRRLANPGFLGSHPPAPLVEELRSIVPANDLEAALDTLRSFKKNHLARIRRLDVDGSLSRREVLQRLATLAEAVLDVAAGLARTELAKIYGLPSWQDVDRNTYDNESATVAMGKLAGQEINYQSDLDLIFIYAYEGSSSGPCVITATEWFTKYVQRLISFLGVMTKAGTAYQIDTELRPSGRAGTLVSSLASFLEYQSTQAVLWEKQALLRSRVLAPASPFRTELAQHLKLQVMQTPPHPRLARDIFAMKKKIEKERARDTLWDLKYSAGGLMDIEFLVQYYQLKGGRIHPELITPSTYGALERLAARSILPPTEMAQLLQTYDFYRTLESHIHWIDPHLKLTSSAKNLPKVCAAMGLTSVGLALESIQEKANVIQGIFTKHLGAT